MAKKGYVGIQRSSLDLQILLRCLFRGQEVRQGWPFVWLDLRGVTSFSGSAPGFLDFLSYFSCNVGQDCAGVDEQDDRGMEGDTGH